MRVGPMPIIAADKILRTLRKHGQDGEIVMTGEEFQPEEQLAHPRVEQLKDLCFVDFDEQFLALVKPDLIRLALIADEDHVSTGDELDAVDWICPTCGKTFEQQGMCPVHAIPLVTFEDYATAKRAKSSAMPPGLVYVLIALAGAAYYFFKMR